MDEAAVSKVVGKVLKDIDEDLLSYIAGMITDHDTENVEELATTLHPVLESAEATKDEKNSLKITKKIVSRLEKQGISLWEDKKKDEEGSSKLLDAPITISESNTFVDKNVLDFMWDRDNNAYAKSNNSSEFIADPKRKKKAEKKERKEAERRAAEAEAYRKKAAEEKKTENPVFYIPASSDASLTDVIVDNITVGYGGKPLIEYSSLKLIQGRHYGLVGPNGTGKSTLLRHIAGRQIEGFPKNVTALHVEQEVAGDDRSVIDTVICSDLELGKLIHMEQAIMEKMKALEPAEGTEGKEGKVEEGDAEGSTPATSAPSPPSSESKKEADNFNLPDDPTALAKKLQEVSDHMMQIGASSAEARAAEILAGLQFSDAMTRLPTKALSGGWRMRVSLACALFVQPDILMLDEPTNHLDFPAVIWLEQYLQKYRSTMIIVSHDRIFLNNVSTDIIHLANRKLSYYRGNYDTFEQVRMEQIRNLNKQAEAQEHQRQHLQQFIDKFRFNAKRAALVQSRIKALNKLEEVETITEDPKFRFYFPSCGRLGGAVVRVTDASFGYRKDRVLIDDANFSIDQDSRIAIVGPNGVGKSTLLKLLLGKIEPLSGTVWKNGKLKVAYFTQHHADSLDLASTPADLLMEQYPGTKMEAARKHLGQFGISGDLALQRIGTLSGGQKSRVAFALGAFPRPQLLVMDEPTNHLDVETIDALALALDTYEGGVVVVSHDQYFLTCVAKELWYIENSKIKVFDGDLEEYKKFASKQTPVVQEYHEQVYNVIRHSTNARQHAVPFEEGRTL